MTKTEKRISVVLCGDAVIHESVYMDAMKEDGSFVFDRQLHDVGNMIRPYDLRYYNQETILGGRALGLSGYPSFNSPAEFGEYMASLGFNLISTATNHCLDRGFKGIRNTSAFFAGHPEILSAGTAASMQEKNTIASRTFGGIRTAFLSWCQQTNGNVPDYPWEVNLFTGHEEEMLEEIRRAKRENDAVILALHWGKEYSRNPGEAERALAVRCVEAGADLIVGNHVHVINPVELIHGVPVFYALGNLISSQLNTENLISMIAGLDLVMEEEGEMRRVRCENLRAEFLYTSMKGVYPALRTDIRVIPFSELDETVLPGYQTLRSALEAHVNAMNAGVSFTGI